jgi:hypothetical protein
MSGADNELRSFVACTAAGDEVELHCDRVRITSRGDLLAIVGGLDLSDERARCVAALPVGAWVAVSDGDFVDAIPMPVVRRPTA